MKPVFSRLAVLAALTVVVLFVGSAPPPAMAAYERCWHVCGYVSPEYQCSCIPPYILTTCAEGCGGLAFFSGETDSMVSAEAFLDAIAVESPSQPPASAPVAPLCTESLDIVD